jgi:hypothetical protein
MSAFCITGILIGLYLIVASLMNSDWIRGIVEIDLIDRIFVESPARIACAVAGIVLIIASGLDWANVL